MTTARVDDTRSRLIDAAERLFAERGIDGVSLREITRESGARNAIALQYHFEDRDGVLRAILDKHLPDVESRRMAMLDEYEAGGEDDLRKLAAALVRPMAAKLTDQDGRRFLQIHADLTDRPRAGFEEGTPSIERWRRLAGPLIDDDAARLHRRFTAMLHMNLELARRARTGRRSDDRLFTSYVIDVITAILAAPVSDETRRLAKERDSKRGKR